MLLNKKEFTVFSPTKTRQHQIGAGSTSRIYLTTHKPSGQQFALKTTPLQKVYHFVNISREIAIQSQIDHQHVIRLKGYYLHGGDVCIVQEYAQFGNLLQFQQKTQQLNFKQKISIFIKLCGAIKYLHDRSVLHRDIKPENILLGKDLQPKLCDFGQSVIVDQARDTVCGTFEFMAPELFRNQKYGLPVDIWSLGVFLYELLHDKSPFYSEDVDEIQHNVFNKKLEVDSIYPESLCDLMESMLVRSPQERVDIAGVLLHPFVASWIAGESWVAAPRNFDVLGSGKNFKIMINSRRNSAKVVKKSGSLLWQYKVVVKKLVQKIKKSKCLEYKKY